MAPNIYSAVAPPIHQLTIKTAFDGLTAREKLYAHHMSRAAWHGTRIILRQVSPESPDIYDFILELYRTCSGIWQVIVDEGQATPAELEAFLNYSATFLSNVGNYYGQGDQKFIPDVSAECLARLAKRSGTLEQLYERIAGPILSVPPFTLGYPTTGSQSAYYPGGIPIGAAEVNAVSRALEERGLYPENTRLAKTSSGDVSTYQLLQASVEQDHQPTRLGVLRSGEPVLLIRGDHSSELAKICFSLAEASQYAANDRQRLFLSHYIQSFRTGDLDIYRDSQRTWIQDKNPRVENIFGFVEPYRDPAGIRAEFEGLVAISDAEETQKLSRLVEHSDTFIKRLPWTVEGSGENNGKGPFEKALFEPPDFTSIHALAYCSSIIFPGINMPNYNDIRQEHGFKNVIIANRMTAESHDPAPCPFVDPAEADTFQKHKYAAYYLWVVLHELLGHGTGKLLTEDAKGQFNFDSAKPPTNPLTGQPIESWYKPGQTWTGQFGDLATTVDECRAELVGAYLMDDVELLALFGFTAESDVTAEDSYNLYLQLGVDGLRGLANFNPENGTWGQAHSRAHFAMLKCLLTDTAGQFITVDCNKQDRKLTVRIDRTAILSHAKPALGRMLLRLHICRSIGDVGYCRELYEEYSRVDSVHLEWRDVVLAQRQPRWVYVQANTFLEADGEVVLREYDATPRGVVQSWAERSV